VKGDVEKRVRDEKARDLAKKKAEETVALMSKGEATAKAQETGFFGFGEKSIPKVGASPELEGAAFSLTAAAPAAKSPFKVGDRWYAVKLKERKAAPQDGFQKAKEQLRAEILPKKQSEAVEKWLKEQRDKSKIETDPRITE
jgi:peptidyl-prolyl cis-trans isomerase D